MLVSIWVTSHTLPSTKTMKSPRKAPTKSLERAVMLEARGRCPWCEDGKKLKASEVEIHHIDGNPANTVLENLILSCRNHHGQIEGQVIPRWEVELKKMCLNNPGTLERLGLKKLDQTPAPKRRKPVVKVNVAGNNSGVVAGTVNNHGTMAGTIRYGTPPKGPIQVVGSLVTSVDHYGYVEYLIKRLLHYHTWRPSGKAPPDNPGTVRKIFEHEFGRLPKDLALDRFEDAVIYLEAGINNTVLGRMGRAGYSKFEAWKRKGRPKK